jgi:glycerol-3-phosphate O-acyltransferase
VVAVSLDDEIVVHVPAEKRVALDFYKNNTIHFFLLAALLVDGLSRGLRGSDLDDDVIWWLNMFRWEFPLPEGDQLPRDLVRLRDDLRAEGVLVGNDGEEELVGQHPFLATASAILDNFREAYWVAAKVLMALPEDGIARGAVLEQMHERYDTGLLLGEVKKPEGDSRVTLSNALSRFAEINCVAIESASKGKERIVRRGTGFADLSALTERIGARLRSLRCE